MQILLLYTAFVPTCSCIYSGCPANINLLEVGRRVCLDKKHSICYFDKLAGVA